MELTSNDVCPLDGRRDPTHLLHLLACTQILSLVALHQFLRLRSEQAVLWKLFFYLLFPLGPVIWLVVVLVVPGLHPLNNGTKADRRFMREMQYILLWSVGLNPTVTDERRSAKISDETSRFRSARPLRKVFAHLIVPGSFLIYCLAIIWMCSRRLYMGMCNAQWYDFHHWLDPVTFADHRLLEIAVSGTMIAALSIHQSPYLSPDHPPVYSPTYTDARSVQVRENFRKAVKDHSFFPEDFTNILMTYIPIIVIKQCGLLCKNLAADKGILWIAVCFGITEGPQILLPARDVEAGVRRLPTRRKFLLFVAASVTAASVMYLAFHGPLYSLVISVFELWQENGELRSWPTDKPCPRLRRDPLIPSVPGLIRTNAWPETWPARTNRGS